MTDLRAAAEMALEALEWHEEQDEEIRYNECPSRAAIEALRQTLVQPEQDHGFDRTASHMAGEYVDTAQHEQSSAMDEWRAMVVVNLLRRCPNLSKHELRELAAHFESRLPVAQPEQVAMKQGWNVDTLLDKQEPVAWVKEGKVRVGFGRIEERKYVQFDQTLPVGTKLYTAPVSKSEQAPVAYADPLDLAKDGNWDTFICKHASENHEGSRFKVPLFTSPISKPWQSLTDGAIDAAVEAWFKNPDDAFRPRMRAAIEAALRSKNEG